MAKEKFIIEPHFRLQEWVAEEKGYFKDEGLDYIFREMVKSTDGKHHDKGDKVGAMQSFEEGRKSDVSCACHWTVGVAASKGKGQLYGDVYSVSPSGIFVPPDSPIKTPEDLAGVPISVGFQSGSHYAIDPGARAVHAGRQDQPVVRRRHAVQAHGQPARRQVAGVDAVLRAVLLAEQLGFRKIIDNTFMIATMINGDPDPEDLRKFFNALRRAQRDIDLRPDLYTHYYKNEFPVRYHEVMDTRRWGPGERLVFEPYTKEVYDETFKWIAEHGIFDDTGDGIGQVRGRGDPGGVSGWSHCSGMRRRG